MSNDESSDGDTKPTGGQSNVLLQSWGEADWLLMYYHSNHTVLMCVSRTLKYGQSPCFNVQETH